MFNKFFTKAFLAKAMPIVMAGVMAVSQAIAEQKEADRMDEMEERLNRLEKKKEEA